VDAIEYIVDIEVISDRSLTKAIMPVFIGSVVTPKNVADKLDVGVCVGGVADFAASLAACVDGGAEKSEEGEGVEGGELHGHVGEGSWEQCLQQYIAAICNMNLHIICKICERYESCKECYYTNSHRCQSNYRVNVAIIVHVALVSLCSYWAQYEQYIVANTAWECLARGL
jgi:hypothetical protein